MNRYLERRMRKRHMPRYHDYREHEMYEPKHRYSHRDYEYDYDNYVEDDYHEDLEHWIETMKHMDRFKIPYDKIIEQAHNMGVKFHNYSEMEFYAAYLAAVTDYKTVSGEYSMYLKMARDFLEDEDAKLKGSDKLCAYMYTIVLDE